MQISDPINNEDLIAEQIHLAYEKNDIPEMLSGYLRLSEFYFEKAKSTYVSKCFESNKYIVWSLGISHHVKNILKSYPELKAERVDLQVSKQISDIKEFYFSILEITSDINEVINDLVAEIDKKLFKLKAKINLLTNEFTQDNNNIEVIKKANKLITSEMKAYYAKIFEQLAQHYKPAPCEYAICAFGSLSSELISIYSDLDYITLTESTDDNIEKYFREFNTLAAICAMEIGQTPLRELLIPCLSWLHLDFGHVFKRGLRIDRFVYQVSGFDIMDHTSLEYSLIITPEKLLSVFRPDSFKSVYRPHQLESLKELSLLTGNEAIFGKYQLGLFKLNSIYDCPSIQALVKYDYDNQLFNLNLKSTYIVKHELLKPIAYFIKFLAKLYKIKSNSVWDSLDILYGIALNELNHRILFTNLNKISWLRLIVSEHYLMQQENIKLITYNNEQAGNLYAYTDLNHIINLFVLCYGINLQIKKFLIDANYFSSSRHLMNNSILPNSNAMYSKIFTFCTSENRLSRNVIVLSSLKTNSLYLFMLDNILSQQFFLGLALDLKNNDDNLMFEKLLAVITSLISYTFVYADPHEAVRLIKSAKEIIFKHKAILKGEACNILDFVEYLGSLNSNLPTLIAEILYYEGRICFYLDNVISKQQSIATLQLAQQIRALIDSEPVYYDGYNSYGMDSILVSRCGLFAHKRDSENKADLLDALAGYTSIMYSGDRINYIECNFNMALIQQKLALISSDQERSTFLKSAKEKLQVIIAEPDIDHNSNYAKYLNMLAWTEYYSGDKPQARKFFILALSFMNAEYPAESRSKLDAHIGLAYLAETKDEWKTHSDTAKQICEYRSLGDSHHLTKKLQNIPKPLKLV